MTITATRFAGTNFVHYVPATGRDLDRKLDLSVGVRYGSDADRGTSGAIAVHIYSCAWDGDVDADAGLTLDEAIGLRNALDTAISAARLRLVDA